MFKWVPYPDHEIGLVGVSPYFISHLFAADKNDRHDPPISDPSERRFKRRSDYPF
jgi:hypothetical protein